MTLFRITICLTIFVISILFLTEANGEISRARSPYIDEIIRASHEPIDNSRLRRARSFQLGPFGPVGPIGFKKGPIGGIDKGIGPGIGHGIGKGLFGPFGPHW